jgi:hypothetical protein
MLPYSVEVVVYRQRWYLPLFQLINVHTTEERGEVAVGRAVCYS